MEPKTFWRTILTHFNIFTLLPSERSYRILKASGIVLGICRCMEYIHLFFSLHWVYPPLNPLWPDLLQISYSKRLCAKETTELNKLRVYVLLQSPLHHCLRLTLQDSKTQDCELNGNCAIVQYLGLLIPWYIWTVLPLLKSFKLFCSLSDVWCLWIWNHFCLKCVYRFKCVIFISLIY